ncbi:pyridoxamine 5'-phosphate oxidase family protein [Paenibacillus filicis]|uniref:Pyridoxamine 5'-phosphate oxidase family protein n=1 Tax=Paenibacillus filicis TaxID=669464 RepID=A0ABU9DNK5_9BACL
MAEKQMQELTSEMMQYLQGEKVIFLSTLDHEEGVPSTTCISWLLAVSPNKLKFAIDPRSRVIENIKTNPRLTLAFIGLEGCFAISGSGSSDLKQLDGVTIKMTEVSVNVLSVRDIMFYGSKITAEPEFTKTYNLELANKFDAAVYEALSG